MHAHTNAYCVEGSKAPSDSAARGVPASPVIRLVAAPTPSHSGVSALTARLSAATCDPIPPVDHPFALHPASTFLRPVGLTQSRQALPGASGATFRKLVIFACIPPFSPLSPGCTSHHSRFGLSPVALAPPRRQPTPSCVPSTSRARPAPCALRWIASAVGPQRRSESVAVAVSDPCCPIPQPSALVSRFISSSLACCSPRGSLLIVLRPPPAWRA